jgi:NAD(P)-dependent dehydrogenase (short-subunit alcohol dehydrogenase family)
MADPRLSAVSIFTPTMHHTIPPSLSLSLTCLPANFTALILGASAGIGASIAYAFASCQCPQLYLILCSRTLADLEAVRDEVLAINERVSVESQVCDVSDEESVRSLAEYVRRMYIEKEGGSGRLDVVVPNAGYAPPIEGMRVTENSVDVVGRAFQVNVLGTYAVAHWFVPLLLGWDHTEAETDEMEEDQGKQKARRVGRGSEKVGARLFLVIGSLAGCIRRGIIANTGYTISKMAQIRLVEYLSEQYGKHEEGNLLSVAIHPGAVDTDMAKGNTPEAFLKYLVDDVRLCGAWVVWLCGLAVREGNEAKPEGESRRGRDDVSWMDGRLVSVTWDVDELLARRREVVEKDLLKFELRTD